MEQGRRGWKTGLSATKLLLESLVSVLKVQPRCMITSVNQLPGEEGLRYSETRKRMLEMSTRFRNMTAIVAIMRFGWSAVVMVCFSKPSQGEEPTTDFSWYRRKFTPEETRSEALYTFVLYTKEDGCIGVHRQDGVRVTLYHHSKRVP